MNNSKSKDNINNIDHYPTESTKAIIKNNNDNKAVEIINNLNTFNNKSQQVTNSYTKENNNNTTDMLISRLNWKTLNLNSVANNRSLESVPNILISNQLGVNNINKTKMTQNEPRNINNSTDKSQLISIHDKCIASNQSLNTSPHPQNKTKSQITYHLNHPTSSKSTTLTQPQLTTVSLSIKEKPKRGLDQWSFLAW